MKKAVVQQVNEIYVIAYVMYGTPLNGLQSVVLKQDDFQDVTDALAAGKKLCNAVINVKSARLEIRVNEDDCSKCLYETDIIIEDLD